MGVIWEPLRAFSKAPKEEHVRSLHLYFVFPIDNEWTFVDNGRNFGMKSQNSLTYPGGHYTIAKTTTSQ
jgi:hypothetical protein